MAGFFDNITSGYKNLTAKIRSIGSFGMDYQDLVLKNSMAVGRNEASYLKGGGGVLDDLLAGIKRSDSYDGDYYSFFDQNFSSKVEFLRNFALNPEIEFILDLICDESIVYDDKNFFAQPQYTHMNSLSEKVLEKMQERYKEIYMVFGFNRGQLPTDYFRKFLIEGVLAFEIVYDEKVKKIIGFRELDSTTLMPSVHLTPDGKSEDIWIQYPDNSSLKREIPDNSIIYISFNSNKEKGRISYTERLIRSFNLLRIIEHTRIIWNVMNASYRMVMTAPISSKSPQKAKENLGKLLSIYKEDIRFDSDSGDLLVNGRPNIQFFKNYMMPSSPNGQTDINPLEGGGNTEAYTNLKALDYFKEKLRIDSKIPFSRFNREESNSMGTVQTGAEGLDQEENKFGKFINRMRSIYQEILLKPLYLQMCIDFPELKNDILIKSQFGLSFNKENMFIQAKEREILLARKDQVIKMLGLKKADGKSFFSIGFVVDKYLGLTDDDKETNKKLREKEIEKLKTQSQEEQDFAESSGTGEALTAPATEAPETEPTEAGVSADTETAEAEPAESTEEGETPEFTL
jgi:hypothetical protein